MDNADRAQSEIELELALAIQSRPVEEHPETGLCHWCEAIIGVGKFCDQDCRDDFETVQRRKGVK